MVGLIFSAYSIIRTTHRKSTEYPMIALVLGTMLWPFFVGSHLIDSDSVLRSDLTNLIKKLKQ